ncbi:MAG: ATP-binding protein, partial [Cytophagales bacterium]
MIDRLSYSEILEIVENFPALMLVGPRQVGKTTLAKTLGKTCGKAWHYFDLENPNHRFALENNPVEVLSPLMNDLVVLDEVQCLPSIFSVLRSLIDEYRVPGRFILTGSADPALVKGVSESLAGRIIYNEMTQLNLLEAASSGIDMEKHWFRGGFPEALTYKSDKIFSLWVKSFIEAYVHRDLNSFFGVNLNAVQVNKLWGMMAHLNGTTENLENLGRSLGLTGTTVKRYIDFMQGSYLVRRLPPWFENHGKRLVKSSKMYLRTSGILHYLLNITDYNQLMKHPALGASWEGYVIEQIATCLPEGVEMFFYRTHQGAE